MRFAFVKLYGRVGYDYGNADACGAVGLVRLDIQQAVLVGYAHNVECCGFVCCKVVLLEQYSQYRRTLVSLRDQIHCVRESGI